MQMTVHVNTNFEDDTAVSLKKYLFKEQKLK